MTEWFPPEGHPISPEKAKQLLAGDLGDVYRGILRASCVPIYWYRLHTKTPEILHNGTLTLVKTPKRILGVTAAHVLQAYKSDAQKEAVRLQLMNEVVDNILERVVAMSDRLDLATIDIDEQLVDSLGKEVNPLSIWPPVAPQEGRAVMLAGYPGIERLTPRPLRVNFGLFTALGVAKTVTDIQITWLVEREYQLENTKIGALPENYNLGGVSGGPLISWFESPHYIAHCRLSGIITEHPNYEENDFSIERLIAIRADKITESGFIG